MEISSATWTAHSLYLRHRKTLCDAVFHLWYCTKMHETVNLILLSMRKTISCLMETSRTNINPSLKFVHVPLSIYMKVLHLQTAKVSHYQITMKKRRTTSNRVSNNTCITCWSRSTYKVWQTDRRTTRRWICDHYIWHRWHKKCIKAESVYVRYKILFCNERQLNKCKFQQAVRMKNRQTVTCFIW